MSGSIEEIRPVFEQLERHMLDVVNGVQDQCCERWLLRHWDSFK